VELDNLRDMSDEQLEALAFDLEPEGQEAVKESDESAPSEPEAQPAEEVQLEGMDVDSLDLGLNEDESKAPKNIQQNLTRALQIERDRRREAEKQMSQVLELLQRQQAQVPQTLPEPVAEEIEPDPFLDPEGFIQKKLAERDEVYRREISELKQAQISQKVSASEDDLKKSGELDEYYQLVNLTDPNHPFYRLVQSNPGVMDKIYAHPKPAQYALEIARNQRMSDPEFAKQRVESLREQIRKEEEAKALKKVQELLGKKTSGVTGPQGVSRLSSATGNNVVAKDIRRMTDAELEAAAFND
jgi:hypothetical protein